MSSPAAIQVMATAAFKEAYLELVPQFERASGHKVITTWTNTLDIEEITFFATGRHVNTRVADAANALTQFFKAPAAHPIIRQKGMEPVTNK